mgnify:CR=1 FL=1
MTSFVFFAIRTFLPSSSLKPTLVIFPSDVNKDRFESCLLQARKKIEELHNNDEKLYVCSMSSQTIVYKGLMLPDAISDFYVDIAKKSFTAKVCLFHQRFSTNTQPRWHLAQPFRSVSYTHLTLPTKA